MKIYIIGPMSGFADNNFPAFDAARDNLRASGHDPISPADLSRADGVSDDGTVVPAGLGYADFMRKDLAAVFDCEAVYCLKGWERSRGGRVEHALADLLGKHIAYESTGLNG